MNGASKNIRLPGTLDICGKRYKVIKDKKSWGGSGATGKQEIVVGMSNEQTSQRQFETFIHEVAEIVTCEQHLRFTATDDDVMFVMNHKQFDRFASSMAAAVLPMVQK